jgi:hypothetical protein
VAFCWQGKLVPVRVPVPVPVRVPVRLIAWAGMWVVKLKQLSSS